MSEKQLTTLVEDLVFPEGPRWHDGRLWFSDMFTGRVLAVDLKGNMEAIAQAPGWLSGLGWLADGRLLVVSMQDHRLLRLEPEGLVEHADFSQLSRFMSNDMITDQQGRSYVGSVGFDVHGGEAFKSAPLVLVTAAGQARIVSDDLACPNGTIITPDGRTLIVAESLADRLTAFDIEADGSLTNRRVWAQIDKLGPDGICLDAEGGIWVTSPLAGEILRILPGGEITDRFKPSNPDRLPTACVLGGEQRRTLFITEGLHPDQAIKSQAGGCIEIMEVDIPGVGLP